ncbi:hypothetical protein AAC03nite_20420 [Alicyclobacillus acidoterrestris]|nr:hypothetical protein AAC03nite_20420 [Alicyclobacillus acidoterrestris]
MSVKIGQQLGHTPIPRDDRRDTCGSGPVAIRPMTPEGRAWVESLKPPVKPKKGEWRR